MVSRSTKPAAKKPAKKPEGRKKSKLVQIGDAAKAEAMRKALLDALKQHEWNLSRTARELEMNNASAVIRALKELAPGEYERARERGDVAFGAPRD